MTGRNTKEYTVAVLADIHGNAASLRAVLADLQHRRHDDLVFAGDYVLFGPRPAEALQLIRERGCPTIHGNTDRFVTHANGPAHLTAAVEWVCNRLDRSNMEYLRDLPFEHRLTPPGGTSPEDDLLIVHATPTDLEAELVLEPDPFGRLSPTPMSAVATLLGSSQANLTLYGHIHYASAGTLLGRRLASIGSVGFPFDGDHRAAYALVHWTGGAWNIEHVRVSYEHERVASELAGTDAPFAGFASARLRQARFVALDG